MGASCCISIGFADPKGAECCIFIGFGGPKGAEWCIFIGFAAPGDGTDRGEPWARLRVKGSIHRSEPSAGVRARRANASSAAIAASSVRRTLYWAGSLSARPGATRPRLHARGLQFRV